LIVEGTGNWNNQPLTIEVRSQKNHQPSSINHQQSTIINQPSAINHQQSTISNQPSSINHHQSTIINQPSSINHHQSTWKDKELL
jgi:hypothetical protein